MIQSKETRKLTVQFCLRLSHQFSDVLRVARVEMDCNLKNVRLMFSSPPSFFGRVQSPETDLFFL